MKSAKKSATKRESKLNEESEVDENNVDKSP